MGIQHRLAGSKMGDGLVVEIRRSAELNQDLAGQSVRRVVFALRMGSVYHCVR